MKRTMIFIIFISLILFSFNCKTNDEIDIIDQQTAEESAGLAAKTVTSLISSVYESSTKLSNGAAKKGALFLKGIELNATYDESTGWWTVSFSYNGYQATLNIQLKDTSGAVQKDFSSNTGTVIAKGSGSGPDLTFTIDWTISGTDASSSAYIVNGSGTLEYKGESVTLTISETEIRKTGVTNPSSGSLTVTVGGIEFVLNYDGNSIITVTYSYNGENHKIVINIHTGEITRLS